MTMPIPIRPTPGYKPRRPVRIMPDPNYKVPNLHSRLLSGGPIRNIEAEWCPVCHGDAVSERIADGRPVWHCDTCRHEW